MLEYHKECDNCDGAAIFICVPPISWLQKLIGSKCWKCKKRLFI